MRFCDWDVLLFPSGSHVPQREFKTVCYAQQDPRTLNTTPLLTCFTPSLPANDLFQISIHSWAKTNAILGADNAGYVPGTKYFWRVKVVIDGVTVASEMYEEDVSWPKQLDLSNAVGADGKALPLVFPRFNKALMTQSHWNATDDIGRIKIQLSAGYQVDLQNKKPEFVKLVDHVIFAFQHTPLDILERSGIAWPHPNLPVVSNPLQAPDARVPSLGPQLPHGDDVGGSTRSTSAYSFVPPTAYPFDLGGAFSSHPAPPSLFGHQQHVRLPSDQIQTIINAVKAQGAAAIMPPPPVPRRRTSSGTHTPTANRRGQNYSDISMHAGCTSYPSCLSEDAEGRLVHKIPSPAVRGKKEGLTSSPTKRECGVTFPIKAPIKADVNFTDLGDAARDFLSTVMDSPAPAKMVPDGVTSPIGPESSAKKRTRSALRGLTLNDGGSPEKKEKPTRKISKQSTDEEQEKENVMFVED